MYLINTDTGVVGKVTHRLLDVLIEYPPEVPKCLHIVQQIYTPAAFEILSKQPNIKFEETAEEFMVIRDYQTVTVDDDGNLVYSDFQQELINN